MPLRRSSLAPLVIAFLLISSSSVMAVTTVTSVTADVASPIVVGTPVTWTAVASSSLGPVEYKFYICKKGTTWVLGQDYSTSNTFMWIPQPADAGAPNYIQVWVRAVGSTAAYEAYLGTQAFTIQLAPIWLSADVDFPTPPGNQVTWTARLGAPPTAPVEYKFQVTDLSTNTATLLRDYASNNVVQWSQQTAGQFTIQVFERLVGSLSAYDLTTTTAPLTVSATPITITSFTASTGFPSTTGTPITFTARVKGGMSGPIQYEFWHYSATNGWRNGQPWGPSPSWTWTPTWNDTGSYAVQMWVRSNGSTATYEAVRSSNTFQINRPPLQLTASTLFPAAPGTQVTWTAAVADPTAALEYEFWQYTGSTSSWSLGQAYSSQKNYVWQAPLVDSTHAVQVWAREVGSPGAYQLVRSSGLFNITSGPPQAVSLTADAALPAPAGTTITFTAGAISGTGPLQYQFWRQDNFGAWGIVQDFSTLNRYTWATTVDDLGDHVVMVLIVSTGSASPFEAQLASDLFQIE
jgi:hypothetical protein